MMGESKIIIYFFRERNKIVTHVPYPECTERNIGRSKEQKVAPTFETFIRLLLSIYLCIHLKTASICLVMRLLTLRSAPLHRHETAFPKKM